MTAPTAHTAMSTGWADAPNRYGSDARGRVLLAAYACSPDKGSEESVGWDTAAALAARGHDVTVLTRTQERNACPAPSQRPNGLRIVCHDLPAGWQRQFDRMGKIGVELGYFLWLQSARKTVLALHRQHGFTSAQHVTYARYWMPSPLRVLDIPWILGPVGGGESIPVGLRGTLSRSGRIFEAVRDVMRWMGERLPSVRHAARTAQTALANTRETVDRLRHLGARHIEIMNSAALADAEFDRLSTAADTRQENRSGFLSIGRLLDWKGFHLGLEAFAQSGLTEETYTIVGDGPFRSRLEELASSLGIADRVHFAGTLDRSDVFNLLSTSRALIHPSLHESGGFVVLEAMAAGSPVICIRTGGPGLFVTPDTGMAVDPEPAADPVGAMSAAMYRLATDSTSAREMGRRASHHVRVHHVMSVKVDRLDALHTGFLRQNADGNTDAPVSRSGADRADSASGTRRAPIRTSVAARPRTSHKQRAAR